MTGFSYDAVIVSWNICLNSQQWVQHTRCSCKLSTVKKAYGSVSFPSTLTVLPSKGWLRIRSERAERSKNVDHVKVLRMTLTKIQRVA
jgi:hypothetical protein